MRSMNASPKNHGECLHSSSRADGFVVDKLNLPCTWHVTVETALLGAVSTGERAFYSNVPSSLVSVRLTLAMSLRRN